MTSGIIGKSDFSCQQPDNYFRLSLMVHIIKATTITATLLNTVTIGENQQGSILFIVFNEYCSQDDLN